MAFDQQILGVAADTFFQHVFDRWSNQNVSLSEALDYAAAKTKGQFGTKNFASSMHITGSRDIRYGDQKSIDVMKLAVGQWKHASGATFSITADGDTLNCYVKVPAPKSNLFQGGADSVFFTDGVKVTGQNKITTDHGYSYFHNDDVKNWKKEKKVTKVPESKKPYGKNKFELTMDVDGKTMNVHMMVQKYIPSELEWASEEDHGDKCRAPVNQQWTKISDSPY